MLDDPIAAQKTPGGHTEEVVSSFNFPHRTNLPTLDSVRRGTRNGDSDGAVMGPNQQELVARGFRRQAGSGAIQRGASTQPDQESIAEERVDTSRRRSSVGGGAEHRQFCKVEASRKNFDIIFEFRAIS